MYIKVKFSVYKGKNLDLGYEKDSLHIRIGNNGSCTVTSISQDNVICTLVQTDFHKDEERDVTVRIYIRSV